jgi:hypothetical protein
MRMTMFAVAAGLAAGAMFAPTSADARFGAGSVADAVAAPQVEQVQYYYGYRRPYYYRPYYRPYYAPRYYAPRYYAPRYRYY